MCCIFFVVGGFSQLVQALMGREMLVVFYGNEISLGLFYGFWLFWIAAGAFVAGRMSAAAKAAVTPVAVLAALLPAAAAGGILLIRLCRRFIDVSPTQFVPLDQLALWSLAATMPVGLLVGALFPLVCRARGRQEDAAGVYIWDALGGLASGALFTFYLVDAVSVFRSLALLTAVLGAALFALPPEGGKAARWTRRGLAGFWSLAGLAVLLSPLGAALQRKADALRWDSILPKLELVESFDTPYQNVAIARMGKQTSVVADGKVAASFPSSIVPAFEASLLYAQHPKARRILLIEGAASGLIPEILNYPVERIDCVEPDRRAFERVREYFPEEWKKAFADERVRMRFTDPRLFVRNFREERRYDIIAALVPDPATAQLNRYFTREFYARARAALAPGGLFVTQATSASNYLGKEVKSYNASIYRTLKEVFGHVRVTPGDSNYFFAADEAGAATLDPAVLARNYMGVRVGKRVIPPQAFDSFLDKDRVAFVEQALIAGGGEVNTDLRPVTYYLNMLLWGRFSGSHWVAALETVRRVGREFFLFPLAILAFFLVVHTRSAQEDRESEPRFSAGLAVFALGFAAMTLEIALLFTYQSVFGHVYQKLGLLNGLFMAGLAAGAWAAEKMKRGGRGAPGLELMSAVWLAAAYAYSLPSLIRWAAGGEGGASEAAFWGLMLAAGLLTGAAFPPAVRLYSGEIGRSSGTIDAADHLGGMLGALLAGTCLVPLFGVADACRIAACALFAAQLPLFIGQFVPRRGRGLFGERSFASFPFRMTSECLAAAAVTVWLMSGIVRRYAPPPLLEFSDAELMAVSGLQRFEFSKEPFPYYLGLDAKGGKRGASFSTFPHSAEVKGYSGPINLLLSLSETGTVRGLKLVESRETPSYMEGIEAWLAKFKGKDTKRTLRLGGDLDGLSGATVTSRAVVEIVNRSSKSAGERVLGLSFRREESGAAWAEGLKSPKFWIVALFLAAFFPIYLRGGERARRMYLVCAVAVMGLGYNTLYSLIDIANISQGRLPGAGSAVWYLLGGFILVTSLLWGQVYCGFVCPFGALQELVGDLGRRLGAHAHATRGIEDAARYVKYVLLTAALCAYWTTSETAWITFNPMQHIFLWKSSKVMALLIGLTLFASAFYFRFWCRYFCPSGAFFSLFNKLAFARKTAPQRMFSLCDTGVKAEYDVDCIQCRRCVHHPAYERKLNEKNQKPRS